MRGFPKNNKHLNIVLRTLLSKIRYWKKGFWNVWKIRRAIFQIFGNSKIQKFQMNDAKKMSDLRENEQKLSFFYSFSQREVKFFSWVLVSLEAVFF